MGFKWDTAKAENNRRKHGVSFEEAEQVFGPQNPVIFEDREHSEAEDRYYAIGFSQKGRLLTVCFVWRDEMIRIISARKATRHEAEVYAEETAKRA